MDKKYYTPEITEFHVGFEFETREHVINTSWQKKTADWQELDIVFDDFEHDENYKSIYRVKYLDKEDIESLGWVRDNVRFDELTKQVYGKNNWVLVHDSELRKVHIYANGITESESINIFIGFVKNKSELIKLMKMLEIDG